MFTSVSLPFLGGNEDECRLNEVASIDMSVTEDETISDAEFFADTVFCQSSDNELFYIDRRQLGIDRSKE
jgi:hypothetical protein